MKKEEDSPLDIQESDITALDNVKIIEVKQRNVFETYEYFLDTNMDRSWII